MSDGLPRIDADVSNVLIFMVDAMRWDHLPDAVKARGVTVKTIATSLATHTSVPTMLSGLHPNRHGVYSWQEKIPKVPHLLARDDLDPAFYQAGEGAETDGIFDVLDINSGTPLSDVASGKDWAYFERHQGGHVPFMPWGEFDGTFDDVVDRYAGNSEVHRADYAKAIERAVDDLDERLAQLDNPSDTLVIVTSDHGEYLGEHGLVGHSTPLRPEGVYVPTVFIHPELPAGTELEGIARHIDLYPTILDALGRDIPPFVDGKSLSAGLPESGYSTTVGNVYYRNKVAHVWVEHGVWDADGGYCLPDVNVLRRILTAGNNFFKNKWSRTHLLRERSPRLYYETLKQYLPRSRSFGSPEFSMDEAREIISEVQSRDPIETAESAEFTQETQAHLEDLGYL